MASKNVQTVLAAQEAFNSRNLDMAVSAYTEKVTFTDQARGLTLKTRDEVKDWLAAWIRAFSDGKITEPKAYDAGDTVVVTFIGRGTNDGPFGSLPATGRRVSVPFCDVIHFDAQGRIVAEEGYYDGLSLLVQLGHAEAPTMG